MFHLGALNDFDKKFTISDDSKTKSPEMNLVASSSSAKSQSATSSPTSSKSGSESFVKIDEMIGPLIENDPLLKEQFEKLAESCSKAGLRNCLFNKLSVCTRLANQIKCAILTNKCLFVLLLTLLLYCYFVCPN